MKFYDSTLGMVLMCNHDNIISRVLHNELGIAEPDILGKPFPALVANSSFQKALSFLVELRARRWVFDWELDLPVGDKIILAHCAGFAFEDNLLVMVAQTRPAVHYFFEEMMRINNDQTTLSRTIAKEKTELIRAQPERDTDLYNQLSSMNNELVTLQRELAKKNAELEHLNVEVQRLVFVDELTQLYNRRGFFELGQREVDRSKRFGSHLSAIMLDIDHFKQLNDAYGHAIGDKVLEEVAMRCSRQLRKVDILGRYGGDEFSILLPETEIAGACVAAERLLHNTTYEPISTKHGLLTITISLGVTALKNSTTKLEELLDYADQALYKAKESGRNQVYVDGE